MKRQEQHEAEKTYPQLAPAPRRIPFPVTAQLLLNKIIGVVIIWMFPLVLSLIVATSAPKIPLAPYFYLTPNTTVDGIVTDIQLLYEKDTSGRTNWTRETAKYSYCYSLDGKQFEDVCYGPVPAAFGVNTHVRVAYTRTRHSALSCIVGMSLLSPKEESLLTAVIGFSIILVLGVLLSCTDEFRTLSLLRHGTFTWGRLKYTREQGSDNPLVVAYTFTDQSGEQHAVTQMNRFSVDSKKVTVPKRKFTQKAALLYDPKDPTHALVLPHQQEGVQDPYQYFVIDADGHIQPNWTGGYIAFIIVALLIAFILVGYLSLFVRAMMS